MEKYYEYLRTNGADLAMEIDPKTVTTAALTIYKCKFGCSSYGKNYCCPPNVPTYLETKAMIDCYTRAILFHTHTSNTITPLAAELARELFLDGYYKAIAFGDGNCAKCEKCGVDHCHFPRKTVPSMEACGIDVFATVRRNGLELHTLRERGEVQNHFGLMLVE